MEWTDGQRAHAVLRGTLGLNLLAHGLARIGHAVTFADATAHDFKGVLPALAVWPFALLVPPTELALGILLLLGLWLRVALAWGGLLIAALMFGTCLRQMWDVASTQLVYALTFYFLASRASDARLAVDDLIARRRA